MTQQTADNLKIIDIRSIGVPNSVKMSIGSYIESLTGQPGMCRQALRLKGRRHRWDSWIHPTDRIRGESQQGISGDSVPEGCLKWGTPNPNMVWLFFRRFGKVNQDIPQCSVESLAATVTEPTEQTRTWSLGWSWRNSARNIAPKRYFYTSIHKKEHMISIHTRKCRRPTKAT